MLGASCCWRSGRVGRPGEATFRDGQRSSGLRRPGAVSPSRRSSCPLLLLLPLHLEIPLNINDSDGEHLGGLHTELRIDRPRQPGRVHRLAVGVIHAKEDAGKLNTLNGQRAVVLLFETEKLEPRSRRVRIVLAVDYATAVGRLLRNIRPVEAQVHATEGGRPDGEGIVVVGLQFEGLQVETNDWVATTPLPSGSNCVTLLPSTLRYLFQRFDLMLTLMFGVMMAVGAGKTAVVERGRLMWWERGRLM